MVAFVGLEYVPLRVLPVFGLDLHISSMQESFKEIVRPRLVQKILCKGAFFIFSHGRGSAYCMRMRLPRGPRR